jgi:hypothetical protein
MSPDKATASQREICEKYGAEFCPAPSHEKLGIADNVRTGALPINGLRHPPAGDTSGWYVWAGEELSADADFFQPLHIKHLDKWCPRIEKYLGLAPGWRFLVADDYEDVWFDPQLLNVT